jgi:hypothetical protein
MDVKDFEALILIESKWVAKRPTKRALRDGTTVYTVVRQTGALVELSHGAYIMLISAVDLLDNYRRI